MAGQGDQFCNFSKRLPDREGSGGHGAVAARPQSGRLCPAGQTGKSRGRRTAAVPITPDLRVVLDSIPRRDSPNILTSARRRPWTEPGLETALRKAKIAAGIVGLRGHDFRGTAATNLVRANMPESDVATILGWSTSKVQEIARRYVTSDEIGLAILDRWKTGTLPRR